MATAPLYPFSKLQDLDVVLASASPRRRQILHDHLRLTQIRILPSQFPELLDKTSFPSIDAWLYANGLGKAKEVYDRLFANQNDKTTPDLIIAADTVVVVDDKDVLEKPIDTADAIKTLTRLSGRTHVVKTIIVFFFPAADTAEGAPRIHHRITETRVTFRDLEPRYIEEYARSGHPLDKAGSYGYMDVGAALVSEIQGDYFNVIGFSASIFAAMLTELL